MIATIRKPVLALALMVVLGVAAIFSVQYATATIGTTGGHTDVGFVISSSFDAATSTWTYQASGSGPRGISHITIGICDGAGELVSNQDWDPDADSRGQDPPTGFPADGSSLTGYKWESGGDFIGTYSFTLTGFSNDAGGAEAVIKAGQDHEHFAGLDGPDCDSPSPTDTPQPTDAPSVITEPSPTETPASDVLGEVVDPPPVGEVLGLPTTGAGGPVSSNSILLYIALASLGAGLLLLGYWRYRVQS